MDFYIYLVIWYCVALYVTEKDKELHKLLMILAPVIFAGSLLLIASSN
mgnify:CR=1 FL=1|tara:strand:- start:434 stop:577 length:144 start_codon:yes stop_codon:yes gene_type:complete